MTVLARSPLLDALDGWITDFTSRPCGRAQAPPNRPYPYTVIYPIPGGGFSGPPLTGPDADADTVWQINAVAADPVQAEQLADAVRYLFLGRSVTGKFVVDAPALDGWKMIDRRPDGGPGGVDYAGNPPNRIWTQQERYRILLTPLG